MLNKLTFAYLFVVVSMLLSLLVSVEALKKPEVHVKAPSMPHVPHVPSMGELEMEALKKMLMGN